MMTINAIQQFIKIIKSIFLLCVCSTGIVCFSAHALQWQVTTLPSRLSEGKPVTIAIALYAPDDTAINTAPTPLRHILVYPHPYTSPQITATTGISTATAAADTWIQAVPHLQRQGVGMAYVDTPSDASKRPFNERQSREVRLDLSAVAQHLRQRHPEAQLHLVGFATVAPLLDIADQLDGFAKIILINSSMTRNRTSDWTRLKQPVLMVQAPGAQCDFVSYPEALDAARRNKFTLVKAGYAQQEARVNCGRGSQYRLTGLESELARTTADWLDGKPVADTIGVANPTTAWREEIITYTARSNTLEATLLLPEPSKFGPGPYPVLIYNHGDIEIDHHGRRYKMRFKEMTVFREFLNLGMAVLAPLRRGVGFSEGNYPLNFGVSNADPAYKARVHAEDILPALAWVKTRAELDASRILLAGQSAGGYSTMYLMSQNLPGVMGAVNFSGGRTDMTSNGGAGFLNQMMVDSFGDFGKDAKITSLWVFAENDSRYTANTIRASHAAFTQAGGKAQLSLSPPIEGDGHFIHNKPELWRVSLRGYLADLGISGKAVK